MARRDDLEWDVMTNAGRTSVSVRPGWGTSAAPRPRQVRPRPTASFEHREPGSGVAPPLGGTDPCLAHTSSLSTVRVRPPSCWINAVAKDGAAATICAKSVAGTTRATTAVCATTENGWRDPTNDSDPPMTAPGPSTMIGMAFASAPA